MKCFQSQILKVTVKPHPTSTAPSSKGPTATTVGFKTDLPPLVHSTAFSRTDKMPLILSFYLLNYNYSPLLPPKMNLSSR